MEIEQKRLIYILAQIQILYFLFDFFYSIIHYSLYSLALKTLIKFSALNFFSVMERSYFNTFSPYFQEFVYPGPSTPLHQLGDLVWVKFSSYPWWPSMVGFYFVFLQLHLCQDLSVYLIIETSCSNNVKISYFITFILFLLIELLV